LKKIFPIDILNIITNLKLFIKQDLNLRIKYVLPVAVVLGVVLCLNLAHSIRVKPEAPAKETVPESGPLIIPRNAAYSAAVLESPGQPDSILECYRNSFLRDGVISFFGAIIHSDELAALILAQAEAFNIAPAMALALCWEESRYSVRAVNRKNSNNSIDRGLFQLNCCSFPNLQEEDFFNPFTNAYYAMSHLRWCLNTGGSEVAALAMYNAGTNRVHTGGTPKKTLDYVSRILSYRQKVEALFRTECLDRWDVSTAMKLEEEKKALTPEQPPAGPTVPAKIAGAR
jgi:hypothetical protein